MKFILTLALLTISSLSFALNHETCNVSKLEINLNFHFSREEAREYKAQIRDELVSKGYNLNSEDYEGLHIAIDQYEEHYDDYLPGLVSIIEINQLTENKRKLSKGVKFDVLYKKQREIFDDAPKSIEFILKKIPTCKVKRS